ncbi:MAG: DUF1152 domain-containing protein [Candidatus Obscuribacterales bacterium]|nr:DUF1152 domain-containing protein [Candidatus Obscuribacterales bacterium]
MFTLPITERLNKSRNVLIAGAGGGFDVFSGLPLFFALERQGKKVHLANWTFSEIDAAPGSSERLSDFLVAVSADTKGSYYFPEKHLCQWFRQRGRNQTIYCFEPSGTQQLKRNYELLVKKLNIDTLLIVDGGTDSLLRGDEEDLGTPEEDMTTIAAVEQVSVETKVLACLGFGIDAHHGVCHAHVLATVAEQTRNGGYLGAISLLKSMEEVSLFMKASSAVARSMPEVSSIVVSSILSALDGEFGNFHATERTSGSELFINPLMCFYWFFDLPLLAKSIIYLEALKKAEDLFEARTIIGSRHCSESAVRRWTKIPI